MSAVAEKAPFFKLHQGLSAETSGGLLVCLPPENAQGFCRELQELDEVRDSFVSI
jgi:selenide,water dikinase